LRLHEERLQDAAKKKRELLSALDHKRLELLELRSAQLEARKQHDPEIAQQLVELRERLAAYEAERNASLEKHPDPAEAPAKTGIVQLGKKTADGIVRIASPVSQTGRAPKEEVMLAQEGEE